MAESSSVGIDTSSYPKAAPIPQQNPLDNIQKLGAIQRQNIGIDADKLKLMNERYGLVNKYFATLLNKPDVSSEDVVKEAQNLVKQGIMPPEAFAQHVSEIPTKSAVQRNMVNATPQQIDAKYQQSLHGWLEQKALKAEDNHNAINFMYGTPGVIDNGQTQQGIVSSPKFGIQSRGSTFQNQLPVGTPTATPQGTQALGPQPLMPPQGGSATGLPTTPMPRMKPISNVGLPVDGSPVAQGNGRVSQAFGDTQFKPSGPMLSQPPAFEEGKKQYSADIDEASRTLQAVKPAQQALKLMDPEIIKGLTGTGPIAEKFTKALSALQGVGIINTSEPVAARQELVKKLAQYIGSSPVGQRSDAAQVLKEAGSPNPNVQVLPALVNLTRDSIALDRVNAAKALAFDNPDFSKYLPHKGNFANSIDERAFKLDIMPKDEREALRDQIKKESKSKQDKFLKSVELARKLKMYE